MQFQNMHWLTNDLLKRQVAQDGHKVIEDLLFLDNEKISRMTSITANT